MKFYTISIFRKIALPVLKAFSRDIDIKHPWIPGKKIRLNSFKHKGYWYHGKSRERNSMELFKILIKPGSTIIEVGGHIGFISTFFSYLTGNTGKVFVFEPGSNNLPYIRENINSAKQPNSQTANNITLIEKAVGAENGIAEFYEDSLTGQNNSLVRDFDGFKQNAKFAYVESSIQTRQVPVITLDSFFNFTTVDFIKIDVDGFEWGVLSGATQTIKSSHPALMVAVQANEHEIFDFFKQEGYVMFNESCIELLSPELLISNIFCLHNIKHSNFIEQFKSINLQKQAS